MNCCAVILKNLRCQPAAGKTIAWLIAFLCAGIFLLPAAPQPANALENGILSGRVVDVSHNPVAGVEVFVYSHSNIRRPADYISPATNQKGEYRITLPPGTYWAVARFRRGEQRFGPLLPGDKHSGAPVEIGLAPGENAEEDFVIADLAETSKLSVKLDTSFIKIEGVLLTAEGSPVPNAYAFANRNEAMKKIPDYVSAWTDSSGGYLLFLPPGTYYLGSAGEFPPGAQSGNFKKVIVDSNKKNINIVTEE
jgi:hypothetical protein